MSKDFENWIGNEANSTFSAKEIQNLSLLLEKIYIGSHIRDEGLRQDEEFLSKSSQEIQTLEDLGLVSLQSWYRNKVIVLTNKGSKLASGIVDERLINKAEEIESLLNEDDRPLMGFIIKFYMSKYLSIEVEIDEDIGYYLEWQEVAFVDERTQIAKNKLFHGLEELGFAVRAHYYVSTRGSEQRGLNYVTAPQIRKRLLDEFEEFSVPWPIAADLVVASVLFSGYKYQGGYEAYFQFNQEPEIPHNILKQATNTALRKVEQRTDLKYYDLDDDGFEIRTTTAMTVHQIASDIVEHAIGELIKLQSGNQKEVDTTQVELLSPPEIDELPNLVQEMVDKKLQLFRVCARVKQDYLFRSSPATEQIVVKFQLLPDTEDGMANFVELLHRFLIEASNMLLQFNQSETMEEKLLYNWLELSINQRRREQYDQVGLFFRELNRLRNYYSHLENAEVIAIARDILERWIDNPFPITREEVHLAKVRILNMTISALSSLENMIRQDHRAMKQS